MYVTRQKAPPAVAATPPAAAAAAEGWAGLIFVLAHVGIALAMQYGSSALTVVHALVTIAIGVKWAIDGRRDGDVATLVAYITGCEVLWRMTNDRLYWETGKYAIVFVLSLAFVRTRGLRAPVVPVLYFLCLLPSALLTLQELDLVEARNQLSFNLSGPLSLMVAGAFFWNLRISAGERRRIALAIVAPIVGVAAIALVGILTTPNIEFTTESNVMTSGGFGPNQVSAALGLGTLLLWLLLQERGQTTAQRLVLVGLMGWLAVQSAMTFSRGGLYGAAVGAACSLPFLIVGSRLRLRLVAVPVLLYLGWLVVWPQLDAFTDGKLTARFQETELTHRSEISGSDLEMWAEHPVLGVGPGVSRFDRVDQRATHTEFTRLLSEHGSFGAVAMLTLLLGIGWRLARRAPAHHKSLTAAMLGWSAAYMGNSAMRLVAPSFAVGLAFSLAAADDAEEPAAEREATEGSRAAAKGQRRLLREVGVS
ncbi:MAG: O-antigen ligase family protein [Vicinamibacterales bacterium]